MCALPDHVDGERIGRRRERAGLRHDLTNRKPAIDVTAENRRHDVERTTGQVGRSPTSNLFRRLQHDQHVAQRRCAGEQRRRANGPCCMHIMTARMHDAWHL